MGAAVGLDRRVAAVVRQQRAEHRWVGKHEDATGVEQNRIESSRHDHHARFVAGPSTHTLAVVRSPRDFFKPLAVGAPDPIREIPFRPSRVIHFFPPQNAKVVAKLPEIVPTVDILLGNLEDAIPMADKEAARAGLVEVGPHRRDGLTRSCGPGSTAWIRHGVWTI